jgi:hypothetical protein
MKLRCINNSGDQEDYLTKGKIYECRPDGDEYWMVTSDQGTDFWPAYRWRFAKNKINRNIKVL